jgi:hypothetical protein
MRPLIDARFFRRREQQSVGPEDVAGLCVGRPQQHRLHGRFDRGSACGRLGHLLRAARHGVIDDQQVLMRGHGFRCRHDR